MTDLTTKINQAVKLIKSVVGDKLVEVCYSGGKDSDVILELTKMAGVKYEAIYKNTTIDPKGTLKHCKDNGCTIVQPKQSFFQIVERVGFPNRFKRMCCDRLKEYKIHDIAIVGVRRSESRKRMELYKEPVRCRFLGSKKNHVQQILPILEWEDADVEAFIKLRGITCHPLYYDEQGRFDVTKRLGCVGCPLASKWKRIEQFRANPKMLQAWLLAGGRHLMRYEKQRKIFHNTYAYMAYTLFYDNLADFQAANAKNLFGTEISYKEQLERVFDTDFTWLDNRLRYEQAFYDKNNNGDGQ